MSYIYIYIYIITNLSMVCLQSSALCLQRLPFVCQTVTSGAAPPRRRIETRTPDRTACASEFQSETVKVRCCLLIRRTPLEIEEGIRKLADATTSGTTKNRPRCCRMLRASVLQRHRHGVPRKDQLHPVGSGVSEVVVGQLVPGVGGTGDLPEEQRTG